MNIERNISIISICWIILWASHIPSLMRHHPFQQHQGIKELAKEVSIAPEFIKEHAETTQQEQSEIENSLLYETRKIWIKSTLLALTGLLIGFLLLMRNNGGRIMALIVASYLTVMWVISFVRHWEIKVSPEVWAMLFKKMPVQTFQELASILIMLTTLVLLSRSSAVALFACREDRT